MAFRLHTDSLDINLILSKINKVSNNNDGSITIGSTTVNIIDIVSEYLSNQPEPEPEPEVPIVDRVVSNDTFLI